MLITTNSPTNTVEPSEPSVGTLVAASFTEPDYRDGFDVILGEDGVDDVAEFARAYFLSQPRWLSLVSMNLVTRQRLVEEVGDGDFAMGDTIGSWKVFDRSDDEIVFGDHMGFMEYRFSFRRVDRHLVQASTSVKYVWPRVGPVYFGLVKPMHVRFVLMSLRTTARRIVEDRR